MGKFFFPLIMGQENIENCLGQAKVERNCYLTRDTAQSLLVV